LSTTPAASLLPASTEAGVGWFYTLLWSSDLFDGQGSLVVAPTGAAVCRTSILLAV